MTKSEKKEQEKISSKNTSEIQKNEQKEKKVTPIKEETPEEKLKNTQEKGETITKMVKMEKT